MARERQQRVLDEFMREYSEILKKNAPYNTGDLVKSLDVESDFNNDQGFDVNVYGLYYAIFMDQGVNGTETDWGSDFTFDKMPPIAAFEEYANELDISPYAIAKSVQRKGIKPTGFISDTFDDVLERFATEYAEAVWEDFYDDQTTNNKDTR